MDFLGGQGNLEGVQTMGIVNAMKTGNLVFDMIIAMCIPVLIGFIFNSVGKIQDMLAKVDWMELWIRKENVHERFIHHSTYTSAYSGTTDLGGGDSQNDILIKAIQLYLDYHNIVQLESADLELKSFGENEKQDEDYYYYYEEPKKTHSFADTLSKFRVMKKPLNQQWLTVGSFANGQKGEKSEVELCFDENKEDIGDSNKKNDPVSQRCDLTLKLRSKGKESIDCFVDKAYKWYLNQLRLLEDDSRYLYELTNGNNSTLSENEDHRYKRYKLSDEKTFESLFFKEKENILKLLDNFMNKKGKYAVKGYPHKLGILLHGPPGTGKTSLIKALAQHTGRSIVNVPLSRISTNTELASIFFDGNFKVDGEQLPVNLNFNNIIFVMEDVDAASKVVRRRDGKKTADVVYTEKIELPVGKSLWRMLVESKNDSCKNLVSKLIEKSERLKKAAQDPAILCSAAEKMSSVPGLGLVGEELENETVSKVASEAVDSAQKLMADYEAVDNFVGAHAETLKQILDAGVPVNEEFENKLLGLPQAIPGHESYLNLKKPSLSRDVSHKQYNNDDDIHVETGMAEKINLSNEIENTKSPKMDFVAGPCNILKFKKDALNLTGILNVLDGVVDTPGRMLIMTTNHPEMLDPALIRPGRIDKKMILGYMNLSDLISMIQHYFQTTLDEGHIKRLGIALEGDKNQLASNSHFNLKLTPAQVEQMASEFDQVDEMIDAIEQKSRLLIPKKKNYTQIVYNA